MAVIIAHASISENGSVNGVKGDQTEREVCTRQWYSKPWNVLIRFTDVKMANKVADCMEMAAKNEQIGYSQATRNTLLNEARKYNYNVSKVSVPVNTDCSALVSVACMYAGIPESALTLNGNCATTRTIRQSLKATGEVDIYTTAPYLTKTDKLKRGDILCKEGAHIVVVVKVDGNPYLITSTLMREGSIGESVKWLQTELNANGANLTVDGQFGKQTKLAVILYQKDHGLVADGIAGAKTIAALKAKQPVVNTTDTAKVIWDYLMAKIENPYGVAGMMGNLRAESGLNPKNLQNSCEKRLNFNDESYTKAVDNGTYKNFATDKAGYGLAQWTSSGRKEALLKSKGNASIGDLTVQLNYLWKELSTSYKLVLERLKTAGSVREASNIVLSKFERPKDQSEAVQIKRITYSQEYFDKFTGGKT